MDNVDVDTPKLLRHAQPEQLCQWEHTNRVWRHVPGATTAMEDLTVPAYWKNVAQKLSQCDLIMCIPADCAWFVELLVRETTAWSAVTVVLRGGPLPGVASPPGMAQRVADKDAKFEYRGPLEKWAVIGRDGRTLKSGFGSEAEAVGWFAQHRTMQERS